MLLVVLFWPVLGFGCQASVCVLGIDCGRSDVVGRWDSWLRFKVDNYNVANVANVAENHHHYNKYRQNRCAKRSPGQSHRRTRLKRPHGQQNTHKVGQMITRLLRAEITVQAFAQVQLHGVASPCSSFAKSE
jgi:hypothetical protein